MSESLLKTPAVYPFVECPNCRQLLEYGAESCPRCREEISSEYALASAIVVHHNTQACSLANSISGGDAFFPLALIASGLIFAVDFYVSGALTLFWLTASWSAMFLLVIVVWFIRFGRFSIGDEEYLRSRREMRKSLSLWLALLVVQLLVAVVWWLRRPAI